MSTKVDQLVCAGFSYCVATTADPFGEAMEMTLDKQFLSMRYGIKDHAFLLIDTLRKRMVFNGVLTPEQVIRVVDNLDLIFDVLYEYASTKPPLGFFME